MSRDELTEIRAELERQDEELAEFQTALQRLDSVDVPPELLAQFEDACEARDDRPTALPATFPVGIRA